MQQVSERPFDTPQASPSGPPQALGAGQRRPLVCINSENNQNNQKSKIKARILAALVHDPIMV
eukprot:1187113-Prorocentrum_minimum.AAC.3